jgi:hypothetical protein
MLDAKGALGAVDAATRALTAARAVDVPWVFAGKSLGRIRGHLDEAATAFERGAELTRSDAAEAAKLLDSAAAATREASAAAQSRFGVRLLGEQVQAISTSAGEAARQVRIADRRQATRWMRSHLATSYDAMTPDKWRRLAAIAGRPVATRPAGLQFSNGGSMRDHLRQIADLVEGGKPLNREWGGWRILNKLRAEGRYANTREATDHLREILHRPNVELTRADLHDLDGLLQLPAAKRPAALAGISHSKVASAAELRARGGRIKGDWNFFQQLDGARLRLEFPDRISSTRRSAEVLRGSYDEMSPDDWRELARIASLPEATRPLGFAHASGNSLEQHLRNVADQLDAGQGVNSKWGGWTVLNRRRAIAQYRTLEAANARLSEIVKKPRAELTRQDIHDLDGIIQLPAERRPAAVEGVAVSSWAEAAELRGRGKPIAGNWGGWGALNRIGARVWWPDRTAATAGMRRFLRADYASMQYNDWQQLAYIASLPDGIRPLNLHHENGESIVTHLREVSRMVRDGISPNSQWGGWRVLNRLRAEALYGTAERAELRLREIATKSRATLTRQDLHDLDGLVQLPEAVRPAPIRELGINQSYAAELRGAGKGINSKWGGWAVHDAAVIEYRLPASDAARSDWVRTQLQSRIAGEPVDPVFGTLLRLRPELIPEDMLEQGRLAIANELLRDIATTGVASPTAGRPALEAAKRALAGWKPHDPAHATVAKQTMRLIDRNLKRMDQYASWDEGYLNHPDYAEVGRVRSNIDLLEQLDAANRRPLGPTGVVDGPQVESASPTGEGTGATVEEVLSW